MQTTKGWDVGYSFIDLVRWYPGKFVIYALMGAILGALLSSGRAAGLAWGLCAGTLGGALVTKALGKLSTQQAVIVLSVAAAGGAVVGRALEVAAMRCLKRNTIPAEDGTAR
jgi:hypothetical protein